MAKKSEEQNQNKGDLTPERDVRRMHEYNAFVKWMSLPANMRGLPRKTLEEMGMDEAEIELLSIKNQGDFVRRFGLNKDTCTKWKNRSSFTEDLYQAGKVDIFQKFYGRVIRAFTMQTIKNADASRFEAWMKAFADRIDLGNEITIETKVTGNVDELSSSDIASMVAVRLKRSRNIDLKTKAIEDVEHEEVLPSTQEYDFEAIERKHRAAKPTNGEVKKTNGQVDDKTKELLKKAIANAKKKK